MVECKRVRVIGLSTLGEGQGSRYIEYVGHICYVYKDAGIQWISFNPPSARTGEYAKWFTYEILDDSNYLAKLEEL